MHLVAITSFLAGLVVVIAGAELIVRGGSRVGALLGVSPMILGLTVVAVGTSAPELATTIMATLKNERDIATGNLIGNSTYNILFVLGVTCLATPSGVPVDTSLLHVDLPLAALVAMLCVPIFVTDRRISRLEGALFVTAYAVYLGTLIFVRA